MMMIPAWAQEALETVRGHVREVLPASLQPFWDSNGFGLTDFDRPPLRPYLVLLVARHYGCTGERPLRLAAGIQMIHMASLLHDRLGCAPGPSGAGEGSDPEHHRREALDILLGDLFFSKASHLIVEDGETRIIEEHIRTSVESAETQARLVSLEEDLDRVDAARCFEVRADKASLLFSLSLRVGAILGRAGRDEEEALSGCGAVLGKGVRILDDLSAWEQISPERPLLAPDAKLSHPLLLLWEKEGRGAWEEAARQLRAPGWRDLEGLRTLLGQKGYLTASQRTAADYCEQALHRLQGLSETEELQWFREIARSHGPPLRSGAQESSA